MKSHQILERMAEINRRVSQEYSGSLACHGRFYVGVSVLTHGLRTGALQPAGQRYVTRYGWPVELDRNLDLEAIEWRLRPVSG